ncbi:MAG: hypothetical protein R8G66_12645 [Cytophagales bacterium]|nr:hypothetical protein [Cytophagales bacterium]
MKFKHLNVLVVLLLAVTIWSCETNDIDGVNVGEDPTVNPSDITNGSGLFSNNSVRERVRGISGFSGPGGFIYSRIGSRNGRTEGGVYNQIRGSQNSKNTAGRTANDDCFTETFNETDNSYEFILDFGDGCEVDGEFMKGKLVERGTFTDNSFSSEVEYTGFGGTDWEVTGTETYNGTWSEDEADSAVWESAYTFASDLIETITEAEGTLEVTYQANGSERMDENSFVVEASNEVVSVSTGESYESTVETPLVMDFTCDWEAAYIFVSGLETGSYSYVDEAGETITGTYSVDYGDGTCDNLITITEDGESEVIDLSDVWDECDDHDDEWEDEWEDDEWEEYYADTVVATYEIATALELSEDGSHFTAGQLDVTATYDDETETGSIVFKVEDGVPVAVLTDVDGDWAVTYEIKLALTTEEGCDYFTSGSLFIEDEGEQISLDFNPFGESCSNEVLLSSIYNDDEEENTGD